MSSYHTDLGIVLGGRDLGERDRIFFVLARESGMLELRAASVRSLRSKLRCGLDAPCLSRIDYVQGKKKTVSGVEPIRRYSSVRSNPDSLRAFFEIADLLRSACPREAHEDGLWDAVSEVLDALDRGRTSPSGAYYAALWRILSILGYAPDLDRCRACAVRRAEAWRLHENGTFSCAAHGDGSPGWRVSSLLRNLLQKSQQEGLIQNWPVLSAEEANALALASSFFRAQSFPSSRISARTRKG